MKIDYISDLHLDFWIKEMNPGDKLKNKMKEFSDSLNIKGADVLILAGDLGHYFRQDTTFLLYMKELYKRVIIVRGNHDMYLVSNKMRHNYKNSFSRVKEMQEFCYVNDIDYLDGDVININGVTFGGCGMSWDKSFIEMLKERKVSRAEVMELFNKTMNDSRLIIAGQLETFNPLDFFESELDKLKKIQACDIMCTHYGPCYPDIMDPEYRFSPVSTFFYFDGSEEIKRINPKIWIYGHTHTGAEYMKGETLMLCNPLGYPNENVLPSIKSFDI